MSGKVFSVLMLAVLIAPMAIAPAGCVSSGGDEGDPPPAEADLSAKSNLSEDDKIHFLRRTHFSFNPVDLQQINALGFAPYLEQMLDLQATPALETAAMNACVADPDYPGEDELVEYWLHMMVNNPNAFQELLALFWHDHFATSTTILAAEARWWNFAHINLWRENGTANLRTLLHQMTIDWQMLEWLDGVRSTDNDPNENFAREFWELFTLGVDNGYTQADIVEASRAFTGFRTRLIANRAGSGRDQLVVEYDGTRHDNGTKTMLGATLPGNGIQEYSDMVNLTLAQRPVAEFICRKIWEAFVYLNPTGALVSDLAAGLRNSNYDLKALFRRIFSSNAFFSAQAKQGLVKSPIECVVGFMRTTGMRISEGLADDDLVAIGQRPTQPPTVNGWPNGDFWLSTQGLLERANFLRDAVADQSGVQGSFDVGNWVNPGQTTAPEVVDRFTWVLRVTLTPTQRQSCIDYLNQDRVAGNVISEPWDYNNATQREKKLRGLFYILAWHPSYAIR